MEKVAPLVGAWIEIADSADHADHAESLPLWERGLKLNIIPYFLPFKKSLPLWERGLKLWKPLEIC